MEADHIHDARDVADETAVVLAIFDSGGKAPVCHGVRGFTALQFS